MTSTRSLALLGFALVLFAPACGGTAGGAAEPAPVQDEFLVVGGCDENDVEAEVKELAPRALPWTYLVVKTAQVQCDERRVLVVLGPGASVVLASVADDPSGTAGARVGPQLVAAAAQDFQRIDPNARFSGERQTTLGREQLPGHCGRVDLTAQGSPLVGHVCTAWRTSQGSSHFVVVVVTDTEQNFATVGMTVDELVGGLVDGLSVE